MRGLVYILLMLVLVGCSDSISRTRTLDEAEAMMVTRPQEAFERLNAIDMADLGDSSLMARWALLYGEAMAANNLYAPTDTIINIAIAYYSAHDAAGKLDKAQSLKVRLSAPEGAGYDAVATNRYLQKEREYHLFRERMERERLISVGVILLFLAAGVILWQRQRLRFNRLHTAAVMAEASDLRLRMTGRDADYSSMESALASLFDRRFALLDSLCATYYETQGTKAERKALSDRVKAEIEAVRADSAMLSEMERTVDNCRAGLLSHLKAEYPDMKPDDYRLAVYLACGLSYRTISLLMDEPVDTLYKRKSRLKARIRERNLPHAAEISAIF